MGDDARWTREFSTASNFTDDLAALGAWVGPRTGSAKRTKEQKEDYVLRRVLVALRRQGELTFPFTVRASKQAREFPDYVFMDASGCWGLEVTEAGSEDHQKTMTKLETNSRKAGAEAKPVLMAPLDDENGIEEIRYAIKCKTEKLARGWYGSVPTCDLAVYDNINWFPTSDSSVPDLSDASLKGRFRRVFFVRDRQVYTDVLCNLGKRPQFVDLSRDYNIDFSEWVRDQVNLLHSGEMSRLDIEELIEELSDLANRHRRKLRSHLQNLLVHLLKWRFQPDRRTRSWQISINNARDEIHDLLMESPSLREEFDDMERTYQRARKKAALEIEIPVDDLPEACPFALETEALLEDWLPSSKARSDDIPA
ncbi:MAG: DUF29 domain-containing protein [Gammaproteobacteria bacterium]|nr:DUF29 domain-containing protein [Gammaproteobacteria bacterium]MDE0271908.1 DUF29 domain-containing protein [Gammaproteobacteria bacterium]